jgi:hypothetical protein
MCTVSWLASNAGYELFFNRDELRRRRRAAPPERWRGPGGSWIAPRDGDAGGSWIAVNEHGVTVALLNRYEDEETAVAEPATSPPRPISRGHLVIALADAATRAQALERLAAKDLQRYRPFTLLVLEPGSPPVAVSWDGRRATAPTEVTPPLASSGFDPRGIGERRRRQWAEAFAEAPPGRDDLLAFHRGHRPERGPYSPCMHRGDARTVSLTGVRVTPSEVSVVYADGPPCGAPLGEPVTLPRRPHHDGPER